VSGATPLIAVVDDEESVRRALERLIRSARFATESFAGGDEFLRALTDHRPDCVVLDIHMPNVDGFQVQSRLANAKLAIPVIVMSGIGRVREKAQQLGIQDYVEKPVAPDHLFTLLDRYACGSAALGAAEQ